MTTPTDTEFAKIVKENYFRPARNPEIWAELTSENNIQRLLNTLHDMHDRNEAVAVQRKKLSDPSSIEYRRWLRSSRNFAKEITKTIHEVTNIIDNRAKIANHPSSRKHVDVAVIQALLAAIKTHQKQTLENEFHPEEHDRQLWATLVLYENYLDNHKGHHNI